MGQKVAPTGQPIDGTKALKKTSKKKAAKKPAPSALKPKRSVSAPLSKGSPSPKRPVEPRSAKSEPAGSNAKGEPTGANLNGSKRLSVDLAREKSTPPRTKTQPESPPATLPDTKNSAAAASKRPSPKRATSDAGGKPRSPSVQRAAAPEVPMVKTFLNDRQLEEFKELLLQKRAQLTGDVQGLASEARGRSAQGDSEHSNMPIHMADLGSDTWEQDFTLGLIVNAESVVREIDEALQRIEQRTYGICSVGNDRIGVARLRAKPWAKYCIEHARLVEEGRLP